MDRVRVLISSKSGPTRDSCRLGTCDLALGFGVSYLSDGKSKIGFANSEGGFGVSEGGFSKRKDLTSFVVRGLSV